MLFQDFAFLFCGKPVRALCARARCARGLTHTVHTYTRACSVYALVGFLRAPICAPPSSHNDEYHCAYVYKRVYDNEAYATQSTLISVEHALGARRRITAVLWRCSRPSALTATSITATPTAIITTASVKRCATTSTATTATTATAAAAAAAAANFTRRWFRSRRDVCAFESTSTELSSWSGHAWQPAS